LSDVQKLHNSQESALVTLDSKQKRCNQRVIRIPSSNRLVSMHTISILKMKSPLLELSRYVVFWEIADVQSQLSLGSSTKHFISVAKQE
jgi:hypothetical protein